MKTLLSAAFPALALTLPRAAQACAVCIGRDANTQRAFLVGTLLLSALPFFLIGGLAWWIRRRARIVAAERELRLAEAARS